MPDFAAPKARQLASAIQANIDDIARTDATTDDLLLKAQEQLIAAADLMNHIQRQLSYTSAIHGVNRAADLALTSIISSIGEGHPVPAPGSRPNGAGAVYIRKPTS